MAIVSYNATKFLKRDVQHHHHHHRRLRRLVVNKFHQETTSSQSNHIYVVNVMVPRCRISNREPSPSMTVKFQGWFIIHLNSICK